jgi:hypothetical protein
MTASLRRISGSRDAEGPGCRSCILAVFARLLPERFRPQPLCPCPDVQLDGRGHVRQRPGRRHVLVQAEASSSKPHFNKASWCRLDRNWGRIVRHGHAFPSSISVSATPAGHPKGGCRPGLFVDRTENSAPTLYERGLLAAIFCRDTRVLSRFPRAIRGSNV